MKTSTKEILKWGRRNSYKDFPSKVVDLDKSYLEELQLRDKLRQIRKELSKKYSKQALSEDDRLEANVINEAISGCSKFISLFEDELDFEVNASL